MVMPTKEGIEAGVTIDIGIRLAMFAAAKILEPDEIEEVLKELKPFVLSVYPEGSMRDTAKATFEQVLAAAIRMSEACRPENLKLAE